MRAPGGGARRRRAPQCSACATRRAAPAAPPSAPPPRRRSAARPPPPPPPPLGSASCPGSRRGCRRRRPGPAPGCRPALAGPGSARRAPVPHLHARSRRTDARTRKHHRFDASPAASMVMRPFAGRANTLRLAKSRVTRLLSPVTKAAAAAAGAPPPGPSSGSDRPLLPWRASNSWDLHWGHRAVPFLSRWQEGV